VTDFRATYRLQLGPRFGFAEALELVPYFRKLGISHLYLSPVWEARHGSKHGYDVTDPTRIREELGGEEGFRTLADAGLGIVLDVVPNHMAADEEQNRFWREERERFFDVDLESGWYRRFFTIDELAGVRVEDPEVFEATHAKVFELVGDGLVDGLRIDHPDGLADPAAYLGRLRQHGAEHVWVEKILEPGERLRGWPVEGTTGYEFADDATALFVNPEAEAAFADWWAEASGDGRSFAEVAQEAKLEVARGDFQREFAYLRRLFDDPRLEEAATSLRVYRTYVEPWSGRVVDEDRKALAEVPEDIRRVLVLEEPGHNEFVTRFQQTTGPVMAKGVEDTALYRWLRLSALNEVGGNPDRFSLSVEEFHQANIERAERFPRQLLATQTHDTKRSGDVRARIAALTWLADEWLELRRGRQVLADPVEDELLWQTLAGAWPLSRERLEAYLVKAAREAKRNTNWVEPNEAHELGLRDSVGRVYEDRVVGEEVEAFLGRVAELGRRISLGMTLLKLTAPGVPDIYWGDELGSLNLVDPDNRRPVNWKRRRRLLGELRSGAPVRDETAKLAVIVRVLELRAARPEAFGGSYEPVEARADVCRFRRGGEIEVVVPLSPAGAKDGPGLSGWRDLLLELPVGLYTKS
jgi:(1->4)-alpha-D-glucan 1-alpha-D-glucosylmutase